MKKLALVLLTTLLVGCSSCDDPAVFKFEVGEKVVMNLTGETVRVTYRSAWCLKQGDGIYKRNSGYGVFIDDAEFYLDEDKLRKL